MCSSAHSTDADADIHRNGWINAHADADALHANMDADRYANRTHADAHTDRNQHANMDGNGYTRRAYQHAHADMDGNQQPRRPGRQAGPPTRRPAPVRRRLPPTPTPTRTPTPTVTPTFYQHAHRDRDAAHGYAQRRLPCGCCQSARRGTTGRST